MDRIEFIGQALQGICTSLDDTVRYFDNMMAAYEVVGEVPGTAVHSVTDNLHSSLRIQVTSLQPSELEDVVAYVNETLHNTKSLYGKSFTIQAHVDGNCVEMAVREMQ